MPKLTTTILGVQADNNGDVWADFGSKWNKVLPGTSNGVTNIAMVLCFAVQKGAAIALELDKSGNITRATF
jgi:hypothetical protein